MKPNRDTCKANAKECTQPNLRRMRNHKGFK